MFVLLELACPWPTFDSAQGPYLSFSMTDGLTFVDDHLAIDKPMRKLHLP